MSSLLDRLRTRVQRSETVAPVGLAVTVGIFAAAGAVILRGLIRVVRWLCFDQGAHLGEAMGWIGSTRLHLLAVHL